MKLATVLRPAALAAGPATVVALGLLVAAMATVGEGAFALDTSPLTLASSRSGWAC